MVTDGLTLTESLASTGLFGADYVNIVSSGEQSGRLEQTFHKLSEILTEQAEFRIKWAVKILIAVFYGCMIVAAGIFIILFWVNYIGAISRMVGGGS